MKQTFILFFFIVAYQISYAQLSGKLETPAHDPVPFANVQLLSANDSSLVKGTLTSETGEFSQWIVRLAI
jgi:hypothetical protein